MFDEIVNRPLGMERFLPWPGDLTLAGIRCGALKPLGPGGYSLADVVEILLRMRGSEPSDDETCQEWIRNEIQLASAAAAAERALARCSGGGDEN